MKKYKSITALLLIVMMLINAFPVIAVEAASFEVETVTAQVGKTVDVKISVKNSPGITSTKLTVIFDEALILESVTYGTEITGNFIKPKKMTSPVILNWANGLDDFSGDYVFATLSFRIVSNAQIGMKPITVTYDPDDVYNVEETNADFTIINGGITVTCPHTDTKNVPEVPAGCDEGGYTAGVWCNDCETYISGHKPISATGNHTDADDQWESDEMNHFRTCDCGHIFDSAAHSGGTATCKEKAKCSVCGSEYGQLNAANHSGGTTTVNASEPNHKTQQAGYTGDTKCLGCGEVIAYGQPIEPGAHTPADVWSNDETHHWKECNVVGCGVVIDGSKATHTSTGANVATCQKQAVCDVCGVSYGSVSEHDYTAESKKPDALKTAGNCRDNAVYYYSCSVCGLVENDDNHTFLGDMIANTHVGGTAMVNVSEANHKTQTDGYTGDTTCLGCNEIIEYGQAIPAGAHTPAINWTTDGTYHWKVCTVTNCGIVIEGTKAEHIATGANVATCKTQAICDVCGTAHGALNAENHTGGTTVVNASEPNHKAQIDGYTGDTKCLGCNNIIAYGQVIPADAHTPASNWTTDETYHWKECTVVGCGVVIEGSKAAHTSTGANVATCQKQAVCDICGVSYGAVADHDFADTLSKDATGHWYACQTEGCTEKNGFAQHTPDHDGGATEEYAIKCTVCQYEIEAQLRHTHVFDKEVAENQYLASKANCTDPAKYYKSCKCGEKGTETFTSGEKLGHTEGTAWKKDATDHWHICTVAGCGVIIDTSKVAHTPDREAATETNPIKCSVCGYEIAPVLTHTHAHSSEWKSDQNNHWNECVCGDKANIAAHKDSNNDGKCDICEYVVSVPDDDNPQTGDNSMISLWIILLCVSGLGIVFTTAFRKKRIF